jgi:hypothetical protein
VLIVLVFCVIALSNLVFSNIYSQIAKLVLRFGEHY